MHPAPEWSTIRDTAFAVYVDPDPYDQQWLYVIMTRAAGHGPWLVHRGPHGASFYTIDAIRMQAITRAWREGGYRQAREQLEQQPASPVAAAEADTLASRLVCSRHAYALQRWRKRLPGLFDAPGSRVMYGQ